MLDVPLSLFISYARTESVFVDQLESDLKARGFNVWVDQRRLEGGQDWMDELQKAIDRCQIVLVVLSPEAVDSRYVKMEYRYALSEGKRIIPLNRQPARVPMELQGLQWIDFQRSYDQGFSDLQMALRRQEHGNILTGKSHLPSPSILSVGQHEVSAKGVSKAGWSDLDEHYQPKRGTSSKRLLEFYIGKLRAHGNKYRNRAHRVDTSALTAEAYEEAAKLLYHYAEMLQSVLEQPTKKMTETVLLVWDDAEQYEQRAQEQNNKILQNAVIVILSEFRQTWKWARMDTIPGPPLKA